MGKEELNQKIIMDLEKLNTYNAEGCPACGRKFSLRRPEAEIRSARKK